jgi:Fe-S oxidoreductase
VAIRPEIQQTIAMCRHCFMCRHANPTYLVTRLDAHTPRGYALGLSLIDEGLVDWTDDQVSKLFQSTMDGLCSRLCEFHWREDLVVQAGREEAVRVGRAPEAVRRAAELRQGNVAAVGAAALPPRWGASSDRQGAELLYLTGTEARRAAPELIDATTGILDRLGCDWTLLGDERDPGIDLWELGYTDAAREAARRFAARVAEVRPARIVTGSSRVLRALRELLPSWEVGPLPAAEHITELLLGRLDMAPADGAATAPRGADDLVAYHDPCSLGRRLSVLDAPRRLIEWVVGSPPVELVHSGEIAECCGGGGLLPEIDPGLSVRMAAARLERHFPPGVRTVVTACPTCRSVLAAAVREHDLDVRILDVVELVADHLGVQTMRHEQLDQGGT